MSRNPSEDDLDERTALFEEQPRETPPSERHEPPFSLLDLMLDALPLPGTPHQDLLWQVLDDVLRGLEDGELHTTDTLH
jgi:hypothetical protein